MIAEGKAGGAGRGGALAGGSGPTSFAGVVDLLAEKREALLQTEVERFVRPGEVRFGRLACALEPGAPEDLLRRLGQFLENETGHLWQVEEEAADGAETLKARAARIQGEKIAEATEHPTVQAALSALPGAEIVEVRQEGPVEAGGEGDNVVDYTLRKGAAG